MTRLALLVLLPFALAAAPALAQRYPIGHPYPIVDQVILTLSAENWVESDTARVAVGIDAALPGADAGRVRHEMMAALRRLAPDAGWRFVRFERRRDASGLERWSARAEARLPQGALGGLETRADQLSRPGLQVRVEETDFAPTLAEIEAANARLRTEIYARAGAELERLNRAFPDRDYRVATIDFVHGPDVPLEHQADRMTARALAAPAAESAGFGVSEKLTVSARIVLQTVTGWHDGAAEDPR